MKEKIELESLAGSHISTSCEEAVELANRKKSPVHFVFNETHVTAHPGDKPEDLVTKWSSDDKAAREAYLASPEHKKRCEEREAEEKRKREAHMIVQGSTEKDLRAEKVPWPVTMEQLVEYIKSLLAINHDYGTCVYAMSMAACAAYYYISHELGVTGFQASCADLDILRRTRSMEGPFIILKGEDALYPQYDLGDKLFQFMAEIKPWLKEESAKKLKESEHAHPNVIDHWKKLAE